MDTASSEVNLAFAGRLRERERGLLAKIDAALAEDRAGRLRRVRDVRRGDRPQAPRGAAGGRALHRLQGRAGEARAPHGLGDVPPPDARRPCPPSCSASRAPATRWRRPCVRDGREIARERACTARTTCTAPYGGVVPELASRDHVRAVSQVVRARARRGGHLASASSTGVAVTAGPGLVGLAARRALVRQGARLSRSASRWSACITWPGTSPRPSSPTPDAACRPTSASSSRAATPRSTGSRRTRRRRCSARRATTRWARRSTRSRSCSGSRIPGGPALARSPRPGDEDAFALPAPARRHEPGFDFSYSGLKTAVALELGRAREPLDDGDARRPRGLVPGGGDGRARREARAARSRDEGLARLAVVGGVAANRRLRAAQSPRRARATASRRSSRRPRSAPTTPR